MSNNITEISADSRTTHGTSHARRMRRLDGQVPGVVYGAEQDPVSITLSANMIVHALENEAFYSSILTLNLDGKKEKVILKDVQRHPYKPKVMHVDFFRVSAKEKLTMTVPIHFTGEEDAPGLKQGGVISHNMNDLEIICLPADLPEFIEIDLSKMAMDDVIHLSQVKLPKGVELVALSHGEGDAAHDHAVASLHKPTLQAEPEEETIEATAAEGAEAESEKPAEGEEGESKE